MIAINLDTVTWRNGNRKSRKMLSIKLNNVMLTIIIDKIKLFLRTYIDADTIYLLERKCKRRVGM